MKPASKDLKTSSSVLSRREMINGFIHFSQSKTIAQKLAEEQLYELAAEEIAANMFGRLMAKALLRLTVT